MTRKSLQFLILGLLVLTIAVLAYLFRIAPIHSENGSTYAYRFRWGKLYSLEIDVGNDGSVDARYLVSTDIGFHFRYSEGWESTSCDGFMDLHWIQPQSEIEIDFDEDRDGNPDLRLRGAAAEHFLKELERDEDCILPSPPTPPPTVSTTSPTTPPAT